MEMVRKAFLSALLGLCLVLSASSSPTRSQARDGTPLARSVTTIYQFPNGTWLENLAMRENGGILLSHLTAPTLIYLDPSVPHPTPSTVHTFPSPATGLVGITELGSDIFYVATLEFSFATLSAVKGSGRLWRVDMRRYPQSAPVRLVAHLSNSIQPNGVTAVPGANMVLVADYRQGMVWRVDVGSGEVDIAVNSSSLAARGVNGIHTLNGYLYLTNSGADSYSRRPISHSGAETGPATLLFQNHLVCPDDFLLDRHVSGTAAFVMDSGSNRVVYTAGDGGGFTTIADIRGPTAAVFGRRAGDEKTIYVSTTGGDYEYAKKPVPVGGALIKIVLA